jgi:hypothetical protein
MPAQLNVAVQPHRRWDSTGEPARTPFPQALQKDCSRISLALKTDYRKGPTGRLKSKVESVKEKLK